MAKISLIQDELVWFSAGGGLYYRQSDLFLRGGKSLLSKAGVWGCCKARVVQGCEWGGGGLGVCVVGDLFVC